MTEYPGSATRTLAFDAEGRVQTDSMTGTYSQTNLYDTSGRLTGIDRTEGSASTNVGRRFEYENGFGRLTRVLDTQSTALAEYSHRLDGVLESMTRDPDGSALVSNFDPTVLGEPQEESRGGATVRKRFEYDAERRTSYEGTASNEGRRYAYDNAGRLTRMEFRDGSSTEYSNFNGLDQPQTVTLPGAAGTISMTYDAAGNLSTRTLPGPFTESQTTDSDVLGRLRSATFGGGSLQMDYDPQGVRTRTELTVGPETFEWRVEPDLRGATDAFVYPSGLRVDHVRDDEQRLASMLDDSDGSLIVRTSTTQYVSASAAGTFTLGNGVERVDVLDERQRLVSRRYERSGVLIAGFALTYDGSDRKASRRYLHRAGVTDLFGYDDASRLTRLEARARPSVATDVVSVPWAVQAPAAAAGSWQPGAYGRTYVFDAVDRLTATQTDAPASVPAPPSAASRTSPNAGGFFETVDGFTRAVDAQGNVTRLETLHGPVTVAYDALSRARLVTRDDGAVIEYAYRQDGPLMRRTVTCNSASNCTPSDRRYVYDDLLLLEEYEMVQGVRQLRTRYHYADEGDIPLGYDRFDPTTGASSRHYFVVDDQGSITEVLDGVGDIVERVDCDPYGRPSYQLADSIAPALTGIRYDGATGEVRVEFSESVYLPMAGTIPAPSAAAWSSAIVLRDSAGTVVPTTLSALVPQSTPAPMQPATPSTAVTMPFEVVLAPGSGLSAGSYTLEIGAGALVDGYGNGIAGTGVLVLDAPVSASGTDAGIADGGGGSGSCPATDGQGPPVAFCERAFAAVSTVYPVGIESSVENSLACQAHLWDADAGLVHMRARMMHPITGEFLQRDPEGYRDSVDVYAGWRWDPVNLRDPTGREIPPFLDGRRSGSISVRTRMAVGAGVIKVISHPYFVGGVQVVGGVLECGGGVALIGVPVPGARVAAGFALVHCADTVVAGVRTLATGTPANTLTHQTGSYLCRQSEISAAYSEGCGVLLDLAAGIGPQIAGGLMARTARSAAALSAQSSEELWWFWKLGDAPRGKLLDEIMGNNLGETFKTFDRFENGVATSFKSINLGRPSMSQRGVWNNAKKAIDEVIDFEFYRLKGVSLSSDMIRVRVVRIAVPFEPTLPQLRQLQRAQQYANDNGIVLIWEVF